MISVKDSLLSNEILHIFHLYFTFHFLEMNCSLSIYNKIAIFSNAISIYKQIVFSMFLLLWNFDNIYRERLGIAKQDLKNSQSGNRTKLFRSFDSIWFEKLWFTKIWFDLSLIRLIQTLIRTFSTSTSNACSWQIIINGNDNNNNI